MARGFPSAGRAVWGRAHDGRCCRQLRVWKVNRPEQCSRDDDRGSTRYHRCDAESEGSNDDALNQELLEEPPNR